MYLKKLITKTIAKTITPMDVVTLFEKFSFEVYNSEYFFELYTLLKLLEKNKLEELLAIFNNATYDTKLFHLMVLKYSFDPNCKNSNYYQKLLNVPNNVTKIEIMNKIIYLCNKNNEKELFDKYMETVNIQNIPMENRYIEYLSLNFEKMNLSEQEKFVEEFKKNVKKNPNYKIELPSFNKKYYNMFIDNLDNVTYKNISFKDILAILNDTLRKAEAIKIGKGIKNFDFSDKAINVIYNYLLSVRDEYTISAVEFFMKESIDTLINDKTKKEIIVTENNLPYIDSVIENGCKAKCLIGYKCALKHYDFLKKLKNKNKIEIDFFGTKPNMSLTDFTNHYDDLVFEIEKQFFTDLEKYIYIYSQVKDSDNKLMELNILMNLCNIDSSYAVAYDKSAVKYIGYNMSAIKDVKYNVQETYLSNPEEENNINKDFSTYKSAFYSIDDLSDYIDTGIKKYNGLINTSCVSEVSAKTLDEAFNHVNKVINPTMNEDYSKNIINYIFSKSNIPIPIKGSLSLEKSLNYGTKLFEDLYIKPSNMNMILKKCELNNKTNDVELTYEINIDGIENQCIIDTINDLHIIDGVMFPNYNLVTGKLEIDFYFNKNVAIKEVIGYIEYRLSQIIDRMCKLNYIETPQRVR